MTTSRQIHLSAFLLSGPVVHSHAVWRHPETVGNYLDPAYYARVAKVVEEGLFDFLFFADRLAVGDQMGGSREFALRYGAQDATRLDPLPILSYLVGQTTNLGLGRPAPRPITNRRISPANSPRLTTCPRAVRPGIS